MNQKFQDLSNARGEEQLKIMKELEASGECFLCPHVIAKVVKKYPEATPPLHEGKHWFVKNNDFPYEGTKLHVIIAPKRHVTEFESLLPEEFLELQEMVAWVNKTYNVPGASLFLRYGRMEYTGATLAHLHFHILHGIAKQDGSEPIRVKLSYKVPL